MLKPYFQFIPWNIVDFKGNWHHFLTYSVASRVSDPGTRKNLILSTGGLLTSFRANKGYFKSNSHKKWKFVSFLSLFFTSWASRKSYIFKKKILWIICTKRVFKSFKNVNCWTKKTSFSTKNTCRSKLTVLQTWNWGHGLKSSSMTTN